MRCTEVVATLENVKPGTVLVSVNHTQQAVVISDCVEYEEGNHERAWYPALVFDLASGVRIVESDSCVVIPENATESTWHIAEHYMLGMDVPMPPPKVKWRPCAYRAKVLATGAVCDCGCGRVGDRCTCDFCGDCTSRVDDGEIICDDCMGHGDCGCTCGCGTMVYSDGDLCGYCESEPVCHACEESHDIDFDGYCDNCQKERRRQEEEEEADRLEAEAAGAS